MLTTSALGLVHEASYTSGPMHDLKVSIFLFFWPQVDSGFTWCSASPGSPKALVRLTLFIDYGILTRGRLWVMESSRAKSRNKYVGHSLASRKLTDGSRQSSELAPRYIGAMRPPGPSARKRLHIRHSSAAALADGMSKSAVRTLGGFHCTRRSSFRNIAFESRVLSEESWRNLDRHPVIFMGDIFTPQLPTTRPSLQSDPSSFGTYRIQIIDYRACRADARYGVAVACPTPNLRIPGPKRCILDNRSLLCFRLGSHE
jgi:hypothetical protein